MATQETIKDIFKESVCGVCGNCGINQYYSILDNFIEYDSIFFSFREIIALSLNLQINLIAARTFEICLDCKDKIIKFYHFKRRVEIVQSQQFTASKPKAAPKQKRSKIVRNIVEIVENYTAKAKCAISSIRIDISNNKLIIESRDKQEPSGADPSFVNSTPSPEHESTSHSIPCNDVPSVNIKDEPESESELCETLWQSLQPSEDLIPNLAEVVVKEEPNEHPVIMNRFTSIPSTPPLNTRRRFNRKSTTDDEVNINVSKAALKMRAYRARLRKPENRQRYLHHQQQQREWNRRHYIKKQFTTGQPIRSRRSQYQSFEGSFMMNEDEKFMIM